MAYLIPDRIETERLILRIPQETDWRDLHEYYSDPECMRYTIGTPRTEGQTWRAVAGAAGHWMFRDYGPYVLELKENGKVIGIAGLWYPNDWPSPEIKWGLATKWQRKGLAGEAVRRIKVMAAEHLPDIHLISQIYAENIPSIKLAESVGATLESEVEFRGSKAVIYRHSR